MPTTTKKTPYQLALEASGGNPEIPLEARQLRVPVKALGAGKGDATKQWAASGAGLASRPVTLLARTAGAIDHWWFGPIVHDFAGMKAKPKLSLDYSHDYDQLVGFTSKLSTDADGLKAEGQIISLAAGDGAEKLIAASDAGIPLEASIDWSRGPVVLEDVPAGATVQVNGQSMPGPVLVVRQWELIAIAVCPHGADGGTSATIGKASGESASEESATEDTEEENETEAAASPADEATQLVSVTKWSASPQSAVARITKVSDGKGLDDTQLAAAMAAMPKGQPLAAALPTNVLLLPDGYETETEATATINPDQIVAAFVDGKPVELDRKLAAGSALVQIGTDARAELRLFVKLFGPVNGSQWWDEGKDVLACWPMHLASVEAAHTAKVDELEKQLAAANKKLASIDRGETSAVSFASDEAPVTVPRRAGNSSAYAAKVNQQAAALQSKRK